MNLKIKSFLIFLLLIFAGNFVFAAEKFDAKAEKCVQEAYQKVLETRICKTPAEAIEKINQYQKTLSASADYASISEEAKLTVQNILIITKYSYMYDINMKDPEAKKLILAQYDKVIAWNEKNPDNQNPYYIVSSGDIINSSMVFLPQSTAIKYGLKEKDDYDALNKKSPLMSIGFINSGLWYYMAPGIGGGSKKKAAALFKSAYDNAKTNYEKFYSAIYMSQIAYSNKDQAACDKYLANAEAVLSGTNFIKFIKMLNTKGYSYFDYAEHKEKIDKKLGL